LGKVDSPSFLDLSLIFSALFLLTCVLLGKNRLRAFISASFMYSIICLAQFPVAYFCAAVIYPVTDLKEFMNAILEIPQLYYGGFFFVNIIITVSCLLAARWIRNAMLKPPLKLYVPFNLLFVFFPLIILFWWKDFAMVTSISYLSSFFIGALFIGILLFLFYIYTRLTTEKLSVDIKNAETSSLSLTAQADKYAPFVHLLSKRELEVIASILAGNVSYKELSSSLNISVNTVKTHLKHIYQTTGVSNIAALSSLFHGYTSNHP